MLAPNWVHLWVNDIANLTFNRVLDDDESEVSLTESDDW